MYLQESLPLLLQLTAAFLLIVSLQLTAHYLQPIGGLKFILEARASKFLSVSTALVALTAVFSLVLGFNNILLALAFAIGLFLSFAAPHLALSFFIANLILRPWEFLPIGSALAIIPKFLAAVAVLSWIAHHARHRTLTIVWGKNCTLFFAYAAWLLLAGLCSGDLLSGWDYYQERFIPIIILSLLTLNTIRNEQDLLSVRNSLVISVLGVVTVALILTFNDPAFYDPNTDVAFKRMEGVGLLSNANDLAALIALALPLAFYSFFVRGSLARRTFGALILVIFLFGLSASQSRGGLLALCASGIVYLFVGRKTLLRSTLILLTVLMIPLAFYLSIDRNEGELVDSRDSRWNYVVAGLGMARQNPFLGVGIGNYPKLYERFTPEFVEFGERTAHSTWVLAMAEAGAPALGLLALLFLSALISAWRIRAVAPEYLLSLCGYEVTITFLSHTYMFAPYFLLFLIFAAERVYSGKNVVANNPVISVRLVKVIPFPKAATALLPLFLLLNNARADSSLTVVNGADKPIGNYVPTTFDRATLFGSKGEVLNFLIKIDRTEANNECWDISINGFGRSLPLNFFRMEKIKTLHPSFPGAYVGEHFDPLPPIKDGRYCTSEKAAWIWADLKIPQDTPAGQYKGELRLRSTKTMTLPIALTVWPMVIPNQPALPAYMEISSWYNLLGHYGKWSSGEAKLTKAYLNLMRDHRIESLTTHVQVPKIEISKGKPDLNLENFPTREDSLQMLNIEGRAQWSYAGFPTVPISDIDKPFAKQYLEALGNSASRVWDKNRSLLYLWDEPQPDDFDQVAKLARMAKELTPSTKIMVTTPYNQKFENLVDIFAPVVERFDDPDFPTPTEYAKAQSRGKEVWWYVSCMSHGCDADFDSGTPDLVIDRSSAYVRSIPWLAAKYHINSFLYYLVNYAFQFYPNRDPWIDQWDFSGNGDGTLFYPGRPGMFGLQEHTPVASVRVKLWREASFDAEYIRWMDALSNPPSWWPAEFESKFQSVRSWEKSYASYSELRQRIGEYLASLESSHAQ